MDETCDERGDEVLGSRLLGDLVVVVDDEPRVRGPGSEILAQDLGERLDVLRRSGKRTKVLAQPVVAAVDRVDVALRAMPSASAATSVDDDRAVNQAASPTITCDPLLGQRRLPVPGRCDEHPHARLGLVEEREQARALDDPALADPHFGDCRRRRRPPLTPSPGSTRRP